MTEAEWLASADPFAMLAVVRPAMSARRYRLLCAQVAALACAPGSVPPQSQLDDDPESRLQWQASMILKDAVEDLERFADGDAAAKRLRQSLDRLRRLYPYWTPAVYVVRDVTASAIESPPLSRGLDTWLQTTPPALPLARVAQVIRDLVGSPFHPVAFDPRWRTTDTVGLARGIYEDRAFDRLPLLADSLMDAGCDADAILDHCRGAGPHVRGCWVVDLVLDKE